MNALNWLNQIMEAAFIGVIVSGFFNFVRGRVSRFKYEAIMHLCVYVWYKAQRTQRMQMFDEALNDWDMIFGQNNFNH